MCETKQAARGHDQIIMASQTAQAIQKAEAEARRDEQMRAMQADIQKLSAQIETLAQQIAQLVASPIPSGAGETPKGRK